MRVGIFTDTYYPEVNGVANSTYQLKNTLEKLGHTVYVFTVTNPDAPAVEKNVYRIKSVPFVLLKERRVGYSPAFKWIATIRALNLDLIHTQTEFTLGHLGRCMSHVLQIPMVHTYHTIYEDYTHYLKVPGNEKLKGIIKTFSRYCCNQAKSVIVPSRKVEDLLEEYGVQTPICIQPTGVNTDKFRQVNEEVVNQLKKTYGLTETDHILLSIGRVSEEKNIMEILNFLPGLIRRDANLKLLVVGDGPQREALQERARKLGIEAYVIFTGMVSWDTIQNYYALGDAFVCASVSETQGLTYIEALAAGKPLLVRQDKCLEGVLQEGINGFAYETKEEFVNGYCKLFEEKQIERIKRYAASSVAGLSLQAFAKQIEKIYQETVEEEKIVRQGKIYGKAYGKVHELVG